MANEKKGRYIEDDFDLENFQKEISMSKVLAKSTKRDSIILSIFRIIILLVAIAIAYFSFSFIQKKINEYQESKYIKAYYQQESADEHSG